MTSVNIVDVTKRWNDSVAVDNISIAVAPGSFAALLGPSGCGKSTTLRLIAGLDVPTAGRIEIGGTDVTALPPSRRGIAMVFQNYALFPHLTVKENIIFGLRVRRVSASERDVRLSKAADILALGSLLDRKPSQLSGGQQQRVALARAIVAEAPVCLMDEPLSNLDAKLRAEMRKEIRQIQKSLGMTMIYVTHDQVEAMTMADQVILMKDGAIKQVGSPASLYNDPKTIFAAQFVGAPAMNFVKVGEASGPAVGTTGHVAGARSLMLGLRPEIIREDPEGIPAVVTGFEFLGADILVELQLGSSRINARLSGVTAPAIGSQIRVSWDREAERYFDQVTGRRVQDPGRQPVIQA